MNNEGDNCKYFALDSEDIPKAGKRKIVFIGSSQKGKLVVKKYNHQQYEKELTNKDGKIYVDDCLIHFVFYITKDDKKKCYREIEDNIKKFGDLSQEEKILKIREHFKSVWKNFTEFKNYADMERAFDKNTGADINSVVINLGEKYSKVEGKYNELLKKYSEPSDESKKILDEMEKIKDNMQVIYENNRKEFRHFSTNTVEPVVQSFRELNSKFEEKVQQLEKFEINYENNKKCELLQQEIIKFINDCEKAIFTETSTDAVFTQYKEIIKKAQHLLESLKNSNSFEVNKAELDGLKECFSNLKKPENTSSNEQSSKKEIPENIKHLFSNLRELSDRIKLYTPSNGKEKIKKDLIEKIDKILAFEGKNPPKEELSEVIKEANKFIKANIDAAKVYNGNVMSSMFGKGYSVLGSLIDILQDLLDKFSNMLLLSNHTIDKSNASSMTVNSR
jgi:hypothetical protein